MAGQLPDDLSRFGVARGRNRAGIDDAQIGRFTVCGFAVTVLLQGFLDQLRFVLVDFTAQSDEATRLKGHWRIESSGFTARSG